MKIYLMTNGGWKLTDCERDSDELKRRGITIDETSVVTDGCYIGDHSTVDHSTVDNSTVDNSTVRDRSTVYNSTVDNSTVDNSTVDNSTVDHSTVRNCSTVDGSTVRNGSTVDHSTVDNSTVDNSTVRKKKLDYKNDVDLTPHVVYQFGVVPVNGVFTMYKKVNKISAEKYASIHEAAFIYEDGKTASVKKADTNRLIGCATGIHVSHPTYWEKGDTLIAVSVNVKDILAIQDGKIRCSRVTVIGEVTI